MYSRARTVNSKPAQVEIHDDNLRVKRIKSTLGRRDSGETREKRQTPTKNMMWMRKKIDEEAENQKKEKE